MAITLAEAQKNVQDDITAGVIDEFRKNNFLLDRLTFDDAVSPTGGGATLTYGYTRLTTQPTAQFRSVNEEYTPQEVNKERHTVDLKVFGGSYQIDRVIANMGGIVDEVTLQSQQKIKAAQALFNDTCINGDSATDAKAFDGLDKALTGSSTEYNNGTDKTVIDLSTAAKITENYMLFLDMFDEFLTGLDGTPDFVGVNAKMAAKIRACARRASMYQVTKDNWGQQVEMYGNIPIIDLGAKSGLNNDVIETDGTAGTTSIYAARLGLDGLHGVSMAGVSPIQTWLPDYTKAGAVKTGEVEMVAALALKKSKAAAVFRNLKIK
ncbi:major capsid protein [Clostridium sp. BJN0001]|uniref:major capsid protein n=1 Tax=Clostridium sp. BJN0001 TaxID=2930219 RepID=UPI001FD22A71|nr:phage capsid protein [Clostridium sp. BJN0001]